MVNAMRTDGFIRGVSDCSTRVADHGIGDALHLSKCRFLAPKASARNVAVCVPRFLLLWRLIQEPLGWRRNRRPRPSPQ